MRDTIELAREADCQHINLTGDYAKSVERLKAFEALVRADEREEANCRANASWTLMCEKMVAIEREQCAKVFDGKVGQADLRDIAGFIRNRGNT